MKEYELADYLVGFCVDGDEPSASRTRKRVNDIGEELSCNLSSVRPEDNIKTDPSEYILMWIN
jgi:hypothetical protein